MVLLWFVVVVGFGILVMSMFCEFSVNSVVV